MAKILVVDDTVDTAMLLAADLKQQGYEVAVAYSGAEALRRAAAEEPDLILLDVRMPGMDGLEVCRRLKDDPALREVAVILLTCEDANESIVEGLDAGAEDYITKPFSRPVLAARVRSALRAKTAQDRLREACHKLALEMQERKRVEQTLRGTEEQLRQAQKLEAVGRLAGGIAHEFNNLLQTISGYTYYAMQGLAADDPRYQDLGQVAQAADRAATLTRQLLNFGRRKALVRGNLDLNQVASELIQMVRPILGEQIQLNVDLVEDAVTVRADTTELQQALLNLCLNGRDAMSAGGTLTLRTNVTHLPGPTQTRAGMLPPGNYAVIEVSDTGCGMSAEVQQCLFDPFFSTKALGQGTGLGLAMVYGVVQQHQGGIQVESWESQGTRFTIYLPAIADTPEGYAVTDLGLVRGGGETILVAEDDPVVQELTVRILQEVGYRTISASDGEEAVEIFRQRQSEVSLLLLDAVMPKKNGHEVYHQIRATHPQIGAVFCTGYDPITARKELSGCEDIPCVEKPCDPRHLLQVVRQALDGLRTGRLPAEAVPATEDRSRNPTRMLL